MDKSYGPQATIRRNVRGAKILLIDDNPDQCALIQTVLQACMPEVGLLVASTAEAALSHLHLCLEAKKELPRLILLDLYLPQAEDGLRIVEQVKKANSPFRSIPLTLITQSTKEHDVRRSYDLGANSYIIKPTNYDKWRLYIDSLRQYWWYTVTLPPV
ncbi:response regulator [Spirosoma areae]